MTTEFESLTLLPAAGSVVVSVGVVDVVEAAAVVVSVVVGVVVGDAVGVLLVVAVEVAVTVGVVVGVMNRSCLVRRVRVAVVVPVLVAAVVVPELVAVVLISSMGCAGATRTSQVALDSLSDSVTLPIGATYTISLYNPAASGNSLRLRLSCSSCTPGAIASANGLRTH